MAATLSPAAHFTSSLASDSKLHLVAAQNAFHSTSSQKTFEQPPKATVKPFELLFPIMARLPTSLDNDNDNESARHLQLSPSDAYIQPQPNLTIPGALPYSPSHSGLTYTHARLPTIDTANHELWKALHSLRPLTADYAGDFRGPSKRSRRRTPTPAPAVTAPHPIPAGASPTDCPFAPSSSPSAATSLDLVRRVFNWTDLRLPKEIEGTFYGVIFRSKRRVASESLHLYAADRAAHEEAVASGGLLMYFYGAPDENTGANLATCVWTSRADAKKASALPLHARAAAHTAKAYESFELSRYKVVKEAGMEGLRLEEWDDDEE